jgi:hypothetical protein
MTRDDIIAMAREAGSCDSICNGCLKVDVFCEKSLERFAELVEDAHSKRTFDEGFVTVGHMREQIAAERNKVASWMMTKGCATGHGDTTEDLLDELDWQITESWSKVVVASVEAEREACAKLIDEAKVNIWEFHPYQMREAAHNVCTNLAAAIRARGRS